MMRLLVVEDDSAIRDFLGRALREAGYTVDAAANAHHAEALTLDTLYDGLVVDLG